MSNLNSTTLKRLLKKAKIKPWHSKLDNKEIYELVNITKKYDGVFIILEISPVVGNSKYYPHVKYYTKTGIDVTEKLRSLVDINNYKFDFNKNDLMKGITKFYFYLELCYNTGLVEDFDMASSFVRTKEPQDILQYDMNLFLLSDNYLYLDLGKEKYWHEMCELSTFKRLKKYEIGGYRYKSKTTSEYLAYCYSKVEKGTEGFVVDILNKKTGKIEKYKWLPEFEEDCVIIGTVEGKGKYKDKIGALIVVDIFGKNHKVGSGLTNEVRDLSLDQVRHKTVTIKYKNKTKTGQFRQARVQFKEKFWTCIN